MTSAPISPAAAANALSQGEAGKPKPLLVGHEKLAEMLDVSPKTLSRWVAERVAPAPLLNLRRGAYGRVLYSIKGVEEWIRGGCPPVRDPKEKAAASE